MGRCAIGPHRIRRKTVDAILNFTDDIRFFCPAEPVAAPLHLSRQACEGRLKRSLAFMFLKIRIMRRLMTEDFFPVPLDEPPLTIDFVVIITHQPDGSDRLIAEAV